MSEPSETPAGGESTPNGRPKPKGGSEKGRKIRRASRVLRDLRHVYEKPEAGDKTDGQKTLRKLFKERPGEFVAMLQRAEAAHASGKAKDKTAEQKQGVIARDEGTERCLTILDEYLERKGVKP